MRTKNPNLRLAMNGLLAHTSEDQLKIDGLPLADLLLSLISFGWSYIEHCSDFRSFVLTGGIVQSFLSSGYCRYKCVPNV
jgi:hypothetical protein